MHKLKMPSFASYAFSFVRVPVRVEQNVFIQKAACYSNMDFIGY